MKCTRGIEDWETANLKDLAFQTLSEDISSKRSIPSWHTHYHTSAEKRKKKKVCDAICSDDERKCNSSAGYCCDYTVDELNSLKKSQHKHQSAEKNRANAMENFTDFTDCNFSHENVIRMNRKYNI